MLVINSEQMLRTVVDSGGSAELMLIRSLGRNYDQDMFLLPLKVIIPTSRQSKKYGREKIGTAFDKSKA